MTLALMLTISSSALAQQYWSGTQTLNPSQVLNDNIILTGNVTVNVASGEATLNGIISGNYSLTKTGNGTLILSANNTYGGTTTISAGNLRLGNTTNTGSVASTSIVNNASLDFWRTNDYTYAGVISGTGSVYKGNNNTKLIFTGENTYSGKTTIHGGTLVVGNGTSGSINNTASVEMINNAIIRFEPGSQYTFSKVISGNGKLEFKATGGKYIRFTANNTFTGTTTIESGELYLGGNTTTGTVAGDIINNGTLSFFHSNDQTFSKVISGIGSVLKTGSSGSTLVTKLTLNGANTYTGQTIIYAGTLALGTTGSIEKSSEVLLQYYTADIKFDISAGSKKINALNSTSANAEIILGSNILTIGTDGQSNGSGTYAGKITGSGNIEKRGTGTLTLSGASTGYSGFTDIYEGIVVFSAANSLGTGRVYFCGAGAKTLRWASGNTADISARISVYNPTSTTNAILDIGSNNVTFASNFFTTGTSIIFTKAGSGKLTITADNTHSGGWAVSAGTLQIGNGTSGSIVSSGVSISDGAILRFEPGANMTFNKVISGAGAVQVKSKVGVSLFFNANHTYTGSTTIETTSYLYLTGGSLATPSIINNGEFGFDGSSNFTYSGAISGSGSLNKMGAGKAILTGVNTYAGKTLIQGGTLQVGNGTGGSIQSTSNVELAATSAILRFEPSQSYTFSKAITGSGKVEFKSTGIYIELTANNNYSGTTTVEQGTLYVGNGYATGAITGNIIVNTGAKISFDHNANHTYSGVISGAGNVENYRAGGILTFTGANTYSGTTILNGTLALSATGTIANSSSVSLNGATIMLDVSTGDKKIKALSAVANTEVILGSKTLTIGNTGQNEGGGDFKGKFTGTGGSVIKQGTATFTMNTTTNGATGTFTHNEGLLKMTGNWAGNVVKSSNANMEVLGNVSIGGNFTISGGSITMNLNTTPPAKIAVTNGVLASGSNTLNITTAAITNYALMTANSGITDILPYTLNMPGMTGTLSVSPPHQLLLTATITDNTPPVPGASGAITGTAAIETSDLSWTAATDNLTPTNQLRYFVYRSLSNNISTYTDCEANGTLLNTGGTVNITSYNAIGLTPNTNYYFNVVVADMVGNKAAYVIKPLTTEKATLSGSVVISGNAVFGETLTANTDGLTSSPVVELGTKTYQWKRDGVNIGSNSNTYTIVEADIAHTITVTVTAANCTGSITSASSATITKAPQAAPAKPVAQTITPNSITLITMAGCEYRMNGLEWQTSPTFTGLNPSTSYGFDAYIPETSTHFASPVSQMAFITTAEPGFVPVTNIINLPKTGTVGMPLTLSGTVVPEDANFKTIIWSITNAGTTGAILSNGNMLNFTAGGSVEMKATIENGQAMGVPYTQLFTIIVNEGFVPVTSITNLPTTATVGVPLLLTGTVNPANATSQTITWVIITAGSTEATITGGNILNTTGEGTVKILAIIPNGLEGGSSYTQEFSILVSPLGITSTTLSNQILVYPNPTTGELRVTSYELRVTGVEIYDVYGRKVYDDSNSFGLTVLRSYDLTGFSNGTYFLKITTEQGIVTKKVIKH